MTKMGATMSATGYGQKLGIAAPQIGISKRVMVVLGVVMVNPTWQPSKAPLEKTVEGCYSVPRKVYEVERAPYGWARWFSIDGVERRFKLNGLNAIVFQHELDHLDGKCCADVGKLLREDNTTKMAKYKILEDIVVNGVAYKQDEVVEFEYKIANLNSIKNKIEKVALVVESEPVVITPQPIPVAEPQPVEVAPEAPTPAPSALEEAPEIPPGKDRTLEEAEAAARADGSIPSVVDPDLIPEEKVPEGTVPPVKEVPVDAPID